MLHFLSVPVHLNLLMQTYLFKDEINNHATIIIRKNVAVISSSILIAENYNEMSKIWKYRSVFCLPPLSEIFHPIKGSSHGLNFWWKIILFILPEIKRLLKYFEAMENVGAETFLNDFRVFGNLMHCKLLKIN